MSEVTAQRETRFKSEFLLSQLYDYELSDTHLEAEDIVELDSFPLTHQKYIKDIFLYTFSHILSKHIRKLC